MYLHYILCIFSIIYSQIAIADFSFKKIYNYVIPATPHQETVFEEYDSKKAHLCTFKIARGNIIVKTDTSSKVFLKAIKKSVTPEELPLLTFKQKVSGQEIIIETNFDASTLDGSIDFEIVIPQKMALNISTQEGAVTIKDTHAPAQIHTQKGSIDIINAHNCIDATSHIKGAIVFHNPTQRIKAQTNTGNIIIHDAQSTVIANAQYGTIEMYAKEVPSTSIIKLATVSGNIALHLPPDVNADLQAYTKQGTITSDYFITLKPQTMQLNRQAWKRLQKQVDGVLGTGEAQIKLSSVKSNIKLMETKTT